jgi:hypothetical protein
MTEESKRFASYKWQLEEMREAVGKWGDHGLVRSPEFDDGRAVLQWRPLGGDVEEVDQATVPFEVAAAVFDAVSGTPADHFEEYRRERKGFGADGDDYWDAVEVVSTHVGPNLWVVEVWRGDVRECSIPCGDAEARVFRLAVALSCRLEWEVRTAGPAGEFGNAIAYRDVPYYIAAHVESGDHEADLISLLFNNGLPTVVSIIRAREQVATMGVCNVYDPAAAFLVGPEGVTSGARLLWAVNLTRTAEVVDGMRIHHPGQDAHEILFGRPVEVPPMARLVLQPGRVIFSKLSAVLDPADAFEVVT